MLKLVRLIGICSVLALPSAIAQESDDAKFDLNTVSELRGQAVRIWRTPPYVVVSVADQDGQAESWMIEFHADRAASDDTVKLLRTLRLGDELAVSGHPSTVSGDLRIQATNIVRPSDNLIWKE